MRGQIIFNLEIASGEERAKPGLCVRRASGEGASLFCEGRSCKIQGARKRERERERESAKKKPMKPNIITS